MRPFGSLLSLFGQSPETGIPYRNRLFSTIEATWDRDLFGRLHSHMCGGLLHQSTPVRLRIQRELALQPPTPRTRHGH